MFYAVNLAIENEELIEYIADLQLDTINFIYFIG
jgi:hypothetical protein